MPDDHPTVPPRSPCPTAIDAERLLATLAAVFDDEAGYRRSSPAPRPAH